MSEFSEKTEKSRDFAPRGGANCVDLVRSPGAVSLVKNCSDMKMTTPTLTAGVVIDDSQKRVVLPDTARLEMREVPVPETELRQSCGIEVDGIVPRLPGVESTVKESGEKSRHRASHQGKGSHEARDPGQKLSRDLSGIADAASDSALQLPLLKSREAKLSEKCIDHKAKEFDNVAAAQLAFLLGDD
jgi:hypothetical protein